MATLNFPDAPDTGDIYTDSNSGFTYEWNGTVWISKDPSTVSNIREIDDISSGFNGSTTAFTLQVASVNVEPANVQQLIISVGGVMQNAGDDYTVSGSTLTFTTAPSSGLTFFGTLLGTALSLNTVADGSVSPTSLTTTSNYIVGGLTADQNAGFVTAYGLVAGAGGVNVSGAVTGGSFSGDGSGLTGVASSDNIITSYGATFLSNVRVAGIFTAANAYVTGILTAQTLNYNNVVDIYSTGIITATRGIQQTGNEGLHVSAGISTVGILTATKAVIGLGVTANNTGIDVGIGAGIITASSFVGDLTGAVSGTTGSFSGDLDIAGDMRHIGDANTKIGFPADDTINFQTAGSERLRIDASGNVGINEAGPDGYGPFVVKGTGNIVSLNASSGAASLSFFENGTGRFYVKTLNGSDGLSFIDADNSSERLRITPTGGFSFSNGLFDEKVNITAGKLTDNNNINLANGMVHYFTTQESTTSLVNIRVDGSNTLQDAMDTGDVCTVTVIVTAAAAGYFTNWQIDNNAVTEEWVGGEAPSEGGSDGLDIYTLTIICIGTGTGDSGFKVIANLTNASN